MRKENVVVVSYLIRLKHVKGANKIKKEKNPYKNISKITKLPFELNQHIARKSILENRTRSLKIASGFIKIIKCY